MNSDKKITIKFNTNGTKNYIFKDGVWSQIFITNNSVSGKLSTDQSSIVQTISFDAPDIVAIINEGVSVAKLNTISKIDFYKIIDRNIFNRILTLKPLYTVNEEDFEIFLKEVSKCKYSKRLDLLNYFDRGTKNYYIMAIYDFLLNLERAI